MRKTTPPFALIAMSTLLFGACSKTEEAIVVTAERAKPRVAKAVAKTPAAQKTINIASLSLSLTVPGGSRLSDTTATAGYPSSTIYTTPTIFLVGANEMFWRTDMAAQKAEIEKDPGNTFKTFTKDEVSEGGFHLEYELASMVNSKATLYGFHLRATIAGKQIDCQSNTSSPSEQSLGVAICRSLRSTE